MKEPDPNAGMYRERLEHFRAGIGRLTISSGQYAGDFMHLLDKDGYRSFRARWGFNQKAAKKGYNPDGVGFHWVKRLFVSHEYKEGEKPEEYQFIQSLVDDNYELMSKNPDYVEQPDSLPEDMRRRWRYGSWDVVFGQYFDEFRRDLHVIEPFPIPEDWRRYIAIDYGLDMLAAFRLTLFNICIALEVIIFSAADFIVSFSFSA